MLTCTFREILTAEIADIYSLRMPLAREVHDGAYWLYAYQNTHTQEMLYVGRSYTPLSRLREHVSHTGSMIERYINQNIPACYEWLMFLFTREECEPFVLDYLYDEHKRFLDCLEGGYKDALTIAERALIAHYWPLYNVAYRGGDRPTPRV